MARSADDMSFEDEYGEESSDGSSYDQFDLQHYLRILRKFKLPITLFTAAVTGLAGYYAYTATPIYSASSTLLIESQNKGAVPFEELVGITTDTNDYYETQFELLRSRGLAQRVVDKLDLWNHPELSAAAREAQARELAAQDSALGKPTSGVGGVLAGIRGKLGLDEQPAAGGNGSAVGTDVVIDLNTPLGEDISRDAPRTDATAGYGRGSEIPEFSMELSAESFGTEKLLTPAEQVALGNFMNKLSISPVRKTKLVHISFESADPVLAATVANTVGEQYITSYLDAKMEMTTKASSWMNIRLGDLKTTLEGSKDRLIAFKESNGLVDVDGSVGRLNETEILMVTAELAEARSELSGKADLYRDMQALQGQPGLLESIPAVQADPLIQNVKLDQGQAQRQLDELRNRYGDRHPRVVDATSQLATLNATLEGHIARIAGSIAKDYQLAKQRVASIEAKRVSGRAEIQAIGTKKFELDALAREVATNQSIYDTFFSRITEAKSADGLESANARISDFALPPVRPVKPKKQLIIALAALASLVLSMLMAFLYEQMDDTIKGTSDIEGKLGLKLLGILPLIKGGMFNRTQELPLSPLEISDKKGTFTEAVNTARTALCLDEGQRHRKIIVITSSIPGEGKSTAAINLSFSLAQLERVLLIDCDMRRPTIAKAAGMEKNVSGLSNLITGSVPARKCIKRGVFEGAFDILPSGPIPEQPLELLSSKRFEKILEQLGEHYDRIVIDSAPTQAVSDALVLGKLSDAVVYVVKSHDTSMELVKRGTQRLKQIGAPLAGVLITQVDIDKITSYGGDYYYQGYYDYYGYTEKGDKSRRGGNKLRLTQEELMNIRTDDSEVNLDLDYGYSPTTGNGVLLDADEFDLTTKLDVRSGNGAYRDRDPSETVLRGGLKRLAKDDLDIL